MGSQQEGNRPKVTEGQGAKPGLDLGTPQPGALALHSLGFLGGTSTHPQFSSPAAPWALKSRHRSGPHSRVTAPFIPPSFSAREFIAFLLESRTERKGRKARKTGHDAFWPPLWADSAVQRPRWPRAESQESANRWNCCAPAGLAQAVRKGDSTQGPELVLCPGAISFLSLACVLERALVSDLHALNSLGSTSEELSVPQVIYDFGVLFGL